MRALLARSATLLELDAKTVSGTDASGNEEDLTRRDLPREKALFPRAGSPCCAATRARRRHRQAAAADLASCSTKSAVVFEDYNDPRRASTIRRSMSTRIR